MQFSMPLPDYLCYPDEIPPVGKRPRSLSLDEAIEAGIVKPAKCIDIVVNAREYSK